MKKKFIWIPIILIIVLTGVIAAGFTCGKDISGIFGVMIDQPAPNQSVYRWAVPPEFDYTYVHYDPECLRLYAITPSGEFKLLDEKTGETTGEEHLGHGNGLVFIVYDNEQKRWGLLDSPGLSILNLFPANTKLPQKEGLFPVESITVLENGILSPEDNCEYLTLADDGESGPSKGKYRPNNKYAYAAGGRLITDFIFDGVVDHERFLSTPAVMQGGKWGFIDQTGKLIIPFEFDDAVSIDNERAFVKQNGKWGIIHKQQK